MRLGIDLQLARVAADERQRRAHVVERLARALAAAEPVVEREPVESGRGQRLQELARRTRRGCPR